MSVRGAALDGALRAAHAAGDAGRLVTLYADAAEAAEGTARPFYLTHAWIFALEAGDARAEALAGRLERLGCL